MSIRVTHMFAAPPVRVFDAWLDPQSSGKWLFATPTGQMTRCEIDPRPGGKFVLVDRRDGEDVEHVGEYLEIDRPKRLVFSFAVPKYSPLHTQVTVGIVPLGDGSELTLTHDGVPEEWVARTEEGWKMILAALERTLG